MQKAIHEFVDGPDAEERLPEATKLLFRDR